MDVIQGWGCLSIKESGGFQALTHLLCSTLLFHNLREDRFPLQACLLPTRQPLVGEAPVYPMAVPVFIKLLG